MVSSTTNNQFILVQRSAWCLATILLHNPYDARHGNEQLTRDNREGSGPRGSVLCVRYFHGGFSH